MSVTAGFLDGFFDPPAHTTEQNAIVLWKRDDKPRSPKPCVCFDSTVNVSTTCEVNVVLGEWP